MNCFNTCFGSSSKLIKTHKPHTSPTLAQVLQQHEISEPIKPVNQQSNKVEPVSESKDKNEDQLEKNVSFDLGIRTHDEELPKCSLEIENVEKKEIEEILESQTLSNPCTNSDDECQDMELEDPNSPFQIQPESSGSLFSLSIESRNIKTRYEIGEKEVSSPFKYVKNLNHLNEVKKDEEKENMNSNHDSEFEFSNPNLKKEGEIGVDASLSSWLVGYKKVKTPTKENLSLEDRPILGALTVEELKESSAKSTPRKSPRPSPDEMPIIGSVGSYWSHTSQTTDSNSNSSTKGRSRKFIKDKRVNYNSTPFATRLERSLDRGTA